MTIDPTTGLVFLLSMSAANGITALVLWRLHPQLRGVGILALGNLLAGPTFVSIMLRDAHGIALHNTLAITCSTVIAEGFLTLAGRRPDFRFVLAISLFTAVLWEAMLALAPDNLRIRVVAITLLSILVFGRTIRLMLQRRQEWQLGVAEGMIAGLLSLHILVLATRMVWTVLHPDPNFIRTDFARGWFFLELTLVDVGLFFGILLMVGSRLARDLNQQGQMLAAERHRKSELRQLLHMLGHELRTPLSIIGRTIESIQDLLTPTPPEIHRLLTTLHASVQRVERLSQALLTAERSNLAAARPEMLKLSDIATEAERLLREKWGTDRLLVHYPQTEPTALGDRELLFTAIVNLLDNALKYSPPDTTVTATVQPQDGEVALRIEDSGIGFPPDQISQIGQRFFRATNVHDAPGTGLGLYMVKTIAQRHGGRLELANRDGGGAEVTLILPAA